MIYLTAIGLSPSGSSTVHIYTQTIHRTTQNKQYLEQHNNLGECGPCPVLASYTLAFALQLRKKHWKTSVRVAASKNTDNSSNGSLAIPTKLKAYIILSHYILHKWTLNKSHILSKIFQHIFTLKHAERVSFPHHKFLCSPHCCEAF